eukprot:7131072-Alexandrium_andersonii.AAC.1
MSASLVGSEMCIRDRFTRALFGAVGNSGWRKGSTSSGCEIMLGRPRPVSYTHLTLPTICSV